MEDYLDIPSQQNNNLEKDNEDEKQEVEPSSSLDTSQVLAQLQDVKEALDENIKGIKKDIEQIDEAEEEQYPDQLLEQTLS